MPDATHAYRSCPPMEEMARDPHYWSALSTLLVSGQVPVKDYIEVLNANRAFAEWHARNAPGRPRFN
jgi:hypothetical protein